MKSIVWIAFILLAGGGNSVARLSKPDRVPVVRILKNAETYLKAHPEDAHGWYMLGRIHFVAFVNEAPGICVHPMPSQPDDAPPEIARESQQNRFFNKERKAEATRLALKKLGYASEKSVPAKGKARTRFNAAVSAEWQRLDKEDWKPAPEFSPAEAGEHGVQALAAFDHAISLQPDNALMHLTNASLLRKIREWVPKSKLNEVPLQLQSVTDANVRNAFLAAWQLSVSKELAKPEKPPFSHFIAAEAGDAWLELCIKADGDLSDAERDIYVQVRDSVAELATKPRSRIMSPIVFSVEKESPASIHGLLAPETRVSFDLSGRGTVESWPWIKPNTCLLAWDPGETGIITSGRQLFGNATFQLVCRDGFEAMRLLDDDGDGSLSGAELHGLAVWRDANSDGISSTDEVIAVGKAGIVSLAVTADHREDELHPVNPNGLTLSDGTTRPIWDWFAESAAPAIP